MFRKNSDTYAKTDTEKRENKLFNIVLEVLTGDNRQEEPSKRI